MRRRVLPIRLQVYTFRVPTQVGVLRPYPYRMLRYRVLRYRYGMLPSRMLRYRYRYRLLAAARGTRPKAGSSARIQIGITLLSAEAGEAVYPLSFHGVAG